MTWRPKPLNRALATIVICAVFSGIAIDSTRQGNPLVDGRRGGARWWRRPVALRVAAAPDADGAPSPS
jgi:hypothetical protein